jgi:hypothetical protein
MGETGAASAESSARSSAPATAVRPAPIKACLGTRGGYRLAILVLVLLSILVGSIVARCAAGYPIATLFGFLFAVAAFEWMLTGVTRVGVDDSTDASPKINFEKLLKEAPSGETGKTLDAFSRLHDTLNRYQSRIGDEYTDIASRTGWLMTSQAFLIATVLGALSAPNLEPAFRPHVATGIAVLGAVLAAVLTLSLYHGHALAEKLKKYRDELEARVDTCYGLPPAGVKIDMNAHVFGHWATRFLPMLMLLCWTSGIFLLQQYMPIADDRREVVLLPMVDELGPDAQPAGRARTETSPAFGIGLTTFDARRAGCRPPAEVVGDAKQWIDGVVERWQQRNTPSKDDLIVLIGGADRLALGRAMTRRFDQNTGIARERAETVKSMLIERTRSAREEHRLTDRNFVVLVTGPRARGETAKAADDCRDPELMKDRVVRVVLPG